MAPERTRISEEKVLELIDLYRNEECLWNTSSPGYRDRAARSMAGQRIAQKLAIPHFRSHDVMAKFKNLRDSYCKELKKVENTVRPWSSQGDGGVLYKPKSLWFAKIDSFLRPHLQYLSCSTFTGTMVDRIEGPEKENSEENDNVQSDASAKEYILEIEVAGNPNEETQLDRLADSREVDGIEDHEIAEIDLTTVPLNTGRVLRKWKKPNNKETESDQNMDRQLTAIDRSYKKMESVIESQVKKKDDVFDSFERYLASSLRSLGTYEALALQPRIMELLATHQVRAAAAGSRP